MIQLQKKYRFKLIIAGEGNLALYQDKLARIDPKLFEIHNQYIDDEKVASFFQRAKLVVLPYTEGTQTGIVPVAYAFGKPVIATDVGSFSEVIEEGKTGLLIPPANDEMLQNAIVTLMTNDSLRKEMGKKGLMKMNTDLSWETVLSITIPVYHKVINMKK